MASRREYVSEAGKAHSGTDFAHGAPRPAPASPSVRRSREVSYHTARSIEELDRAEACTDRQARQAHEHMATLHLDAASRLCRNDLCRIVADRVD